MGHTWDVTLGTDFGGLETPRTALDNMGFTVRHSFTSETSASCIKLSRALFPDIDVRYTDVTDRANSKATSVGLYVAGAPP